MSEVQKPHATWAMERNDVLMRFLQELIKATGDGSKKRQSGEKPPWYRDHGHEGAIFSHLMKWKRGEQVDPDSGAHPLVHAAWRCLAIACSESGNNPDGDLVKQTYTTPGTFIPVDGNPVTVDRVLGSPDGRPLK